MTQTEFTRITRSVAKDFMPKVAKGAMNEFLYALVEELNAEGLDLEEEDVVDEEDDEED